MPYNPAGLFSLVASYFAQPGTTIRTEQHNPPLEDIAAGMSQILLRDGRAPMTGPLNMNGFAIQNVAAGTNPGSVATLAQAIPLGFMGDFAGDTPPSGWMFCAGQAISRSVYAQLFAIIGTKYGTGDGSTTFNLPDRRGRADFGRDDMGGTAANRITTAGSGIDGKTLGASGGAEAVTLTAAQIPAHPHPTSEAPHVHTYVTATTKNYQAPGGAQPVGGPLWGDGNFTTVTGGAVTGLSVLPNTGGGGAHTNMPPTFITNKIIRVSFDG